VLVPAAAPIVTLLSFRNVPTPPIAFVPPLNATAKFAFDVSKLPEVVTLPVNVVPPPVLATDTEATLAEATVSVPEPWIVSALAPVTAPVVRLAVPAFNVVALPTLPAPSVG